MEGRKLPNEEHIRTLGEIEKHPRILEADSIKKR